MLMHALTIIRSLLDVQVEHCFLFIFILFFTPTLFDKSINSLLWLNEHLLLVSVGGWLFGNSFSIFYDETGNTLSAKFASMQVEPSEEELLKSCLWLFL